jgi:ribosomal protein S18 acetylase RimI-like enzyme
MQFELTEALMDDILFSMEDQEGEFYIDTQDGIVLGGVDSDFGEFDLDDDRFISLPEWDSSSGFRLMERFAAGIRNPLIREELSSALNRGKGVFRAFKDTLTRHPEAEKIWFSYKEREMKNEIVRWYNALREEWGLEKIGFEPEETGDLILEDFRFREFTDADAPRAEELHKSCQEEHKNWMNENRIPMGEREGSFFEASFFEQALTGEEGKRLALTAESGNSEFSGYILAILKDGGLHVRALEVKAEYRGMGIGEALLLKLLEKAEGEKVFHLLLDLPAGSEGFSRVLIREGFKPYTTRYCRRLPEA